MKTKIQCKGPFIGQPIIGCDCDYCYPQVRTYWRKKREDNKPHRELRFAFVREIIKRGKPVDENTDYRMLSLWSEIIKNDSSLMTTENIMKVPALLKRLNLFIEFDYKKLSKETRDHVKNLWNNLK